MSRSRLGFCALLVSACSSTEASEPEITFYEDVAPVLYAQCVGCHRPDSITPFSLIDYASAKQVAPNIAHHTAERHMPPMPVDNSGSCNTYSNARWLSEEEIELIARWVDTGAKEGDPRAAPPVPEPPAGLSAPDLVLDSGVDYLPDASSDDDYHCFVVPAPVAVDTHVTAYEVLPGDPRIVHHVIVYQPADEAAAEGARALDARQPGEGYRCFGGSGVKAQPLILWAPGAGAVSMPNGTGTPLVGGRDLVMQIHYNLLGGTFPDRTRVNLATKSVDVTPARYIAIADLEMELAPGQPSVETTATFTPDPSPFTVHGVLPHMHTLGRTLQVDVALDGVSTCMVKVDRWDFHWQNAWWYDAPMQIRGIDSATIRCGYDTSERSETVTWGEGTDDEMCLNYLYVSSP